MLVVFGRGVLSGNGSWELTPGGVERVRAAIDYMAAHRPADALVIFTGGWAAGSAPPPPGHREADLMLALARDAGLDELADLAVETGSRSTLENLANLSPLLAGHDFDRHHPLGLVSHDWHLPRIRFLAGKVLGLPRRALLGVPVRNGRPIGGPPPWMLHLLARVGYLGSRDPAVLLRRERRLVSAVARFRGLLGIGRP